MTVIDCFTSLDDIPKRLRGQELKEAVLAVLKKRPRYSCWDMDDARIRAAVQSLKREQRIRDKGGDYPWVEVEAVD
jgi:hypothetical protein